MQDEISIGTCIQRSIDCISGQPDRGIGLRFTDNLDEFVIGHKAFEIELLILFLFFAQLRMTQPLTPFSTIATLIVAAQVKIASLITVVHLLGNGGLGAAGTTLAAGKVLALASDLLRGLLDNLGALGEDHLDVAGVGHVRVDLGWC